jgi:hypothetical protein
MNIQATAPATVDPAEMSDIDNTIPIEAWNILKICIGRALDDAVEFALALGPAGEIIRLAGETGERLKRQVNAALREALSPYQRADGIWVGSSTWLVTARNPAR